MVQVTPRGGAAAVEVMYLHGGGYVGPLGTHHWWIIDHLVSVTGAQVTVPSYPLAPEHRVDDAMPVLADLYGWWAGQAGDSRLALAGDSAGGGLALVLAMRARDEGWATLDRLLLLAPWVDVTMTNPRAWALEHRDPILRCVGAIDDGRAWAGSRSPTDPWVSPLNGVLDGLPATLVVQGGCDVLAPDALVLVERMRRAGVHVSLRFEPGGFHVYPVAVRTPEARAAFVQIAEFLA